MGNYLRFLSALMLLGSSAGATTIELNSMSAALRSADSRTLVVLDLDNTVIEPRQTLGSDQFFGLLLADGVKLGLGDEAAKTRALKLASFVQPEVPVQAVEDETPGLILELQRRGINVMALTARPAAWSEGTLRQLSSVGISFAYTAPQLPSGDIRAFGHYENGVFFVALHRSKGEALREILSREGTPPSHVIFVDDKKANVESVEAALAGSALDHLSVRYGASDPIVARLDAAVARCEWNVFRWTSALVTDENARALVNAGDCL